MTHLRFYIVGICFLLSGKIFAQVEVSNCNRYTKVPSGYLMVLREGDTVFQQLELLAARENIPSASFTGMGFAEVEFGFFNAKKQEFKTRKFKGGEVASMHGSIAWKNSKPSVHMHGMLTNKRFKARGGHMLSAVVGKGSLEIMVVVHDQTLERKKDASIGADILFLGGCAE